MSLTFSQKNEVNLPKGSEEFANKQTDKQMGYQYYNIDMFYE